jgi:hypothetical protein
MRGKALAAFVAVWMVLVVVANTWLFDRDRSTSQIIMSNIGILIALWIAYGIARRGGSNRPAS